MGKIDKFIQRKLRESIHKKVSNESTKLGSFVCLIDIFTLIMFIVNVVYDNLALWVSSLSLFVISLAIGLFDMLLARKKYNETRPFIFRWFFVGALSAYFIVLFYFGDLYVHLFSIVILPLVLVTIYDFLPCAVFSGIFLLQSCLFLFVPPLRDLTALSELDQGIKLDIVLLVIELVCLAVGILSSIVVRKCISQFYTSAAKYRFAAYHDSLTGIYNHAYMVSWVEDWKSKASKEDLIGVMFIDVDNLKLINDTYGHTIGNKILIAIANTLEFSHPDLLVRWGGDEFIIIERNASKEKLVEEGENLIKKVEELVEPEAPGLKLTISIGAAFSGTSDEFSFDDVIKAADEQLGRSKSAGKDRLFIED